ncbi:SIR2 family NAD-dependent protein deacylase [Nannocystis punicea]|uniref:SIR2 family protein n=1 Tax=Nannocystis punicea TaxID=2995304 RepID=A0ABY7HBL7_9BACT|nr:SIR2 family protein [Nannocystis poenicansa]WAS96399.1 SIR2 family protein [Nannocystis poenicansa]
MLLHDDLKKILRRPDRVVFVVGTGVALGAVRGSPSEAMASWDGLIRSGLERAHALGKFPAEELADYKKQLDHTRHGALIHVASVVEDTLGAPDQGEFRRWLRETVGTFVSNLRDRSVLDAIADHQKRGVLLATTNYDLLLEHVTGLSEVTWRDLPGIDRTLRERDDPQVIHLHGAWRRPESVVLGIKSYEDVCRDPYAQRLLAALRTDRTFVFIGCGAGLTDPNLGAFLKWTATVFAGSEARHYRLCRDSEVEAVRGEHPDGQRIFPLSYGPKHADLAPFLLSLLPSPAAPTVSTAPPSGGVPAAPAPSDASSASAGPAPSSVQPSAVTPAAPPQVSTSPRGALHALLCDLFRADASGLRRLISHDPELMVVVVLLPGKEASLAKLADDVVDLLDDRGLVSTLFARLRASEEFGRRQADIDRVAAQWPSAEVSSRSPPRADDRGGWKHSGGDPGRRDPPSGGADEGKRRAGPSRPRSPWDAKAELSRLLLNGPFFVAEALHEALLGARPATGAKHFTIAAEVAGKIDALGAGASAAMILIPACQKALKAQQRADLRHAQQVVCALLCQWMPRRYDGDDVLIEREDDSECANLKVRTASLLVSAFHVAAADDRPAAIDGRRRRGKWSLDPPVAVAGELLDPKRAAMQIARDIIGQDPGNRGQYEDTEEAEIEFAGGLFRTARQGVDPRPRDLTLTTKQWSTLMVAETRKHLKDYFPDLRQVEQTGAADGEAKLVPILLDIFKDLDGAP